MTELNENQRQRNKRNRIFLEATMDGIRERLEADDSIPELVIKTETKTYMGERIGNYIRFNIELVLVRVDREPSE